MRKENALIDSQRDLWEGEKVLRMDYTSLMSILEEPQEHGIGKGLLCF